MRTLRLLVLVAAVLVPTAGADGERHPAEDPRQLSWVEDGVLAVGGGGLTDADVEWLHEQGFGAVANFRGEHEDPVERLDALGVAYFDGRVDHAPQINITDVRAFLAWADEMAAQGRPIYAHCTKGWHRAATFTMAWEMRRDGLTMDEAARAALERRPGTAVRAPGVLLQYEAELREEPGLAVFLHSTRTHAPPGEPLAASVEVLAGGAPAVGAEVDVWVEGGAWATTLVTGADGRASFEYVAPEGKFMRHLYARASLAGHVDGADNVELMLEQEPKARDAPALEASLADDGTLVVRAEDWRAREPLRFHASTPSGWSAWTVSIDGAAALPPPPGGERVTVRAHAWGAAESVAHVDVPAPPPPPVVVPSVEPVPPVPSPAQTPPPAPAERESAMVPDAASAAPLADLPLRMAAAAAGGLAVLGLLTLWLLRSGGKGARVSR